MDDEDESAQHQHRREKQRQKTPHHKYKDQLQALADRKVDEIMIDLDDLETVWYPISQWATIGTNEQDSMRATLVIA
jgi:hypothetical protein